MSAPVLARPSSAPLIERGGLLVLALTVIACAPQGSLGKDLPGDGSDGASTEADDAAATQGTGSTGQADDTGTSLGTGTGTTSSSGESSTGGGDGGSTTDAATCPPAPDDTPCETCLGGHCCAEVLACESSEPCTCIEDCIAEGGEAVACTDHCGGMNDEWIHLHDCRAELCLEVC